MKRFVLPVLAAGLLAMTVSSARAVPFDYLFVDNTTAWSTGGVNSDGGQFTSFVDPPNFFPVGFNLGPTYTNWTVGNTTAIPNVVPASDTWTGVPASFEFQWTYDPTGANITHTYVATGRIGDVGGPTGAGPMTFNGGTFSAAYWWVDSITDVTAGVTSLATGGYTTIGSFTGLRINTTYAPGVFLDLLIRDSQQIAPPGQQNRIDGLAASVPEPGALALLVGGCVSGSLFVRRRRRA